MGVVADGLETDGFRTVADENQRSRNADDDADRRPEQIAASPAGRGDDRSADGVKEHTCHALRRAADADPQASVLSKPVVHQHRDNEVDQQRLAAAEDKRVNVEHDDTRCAGVEEIGKSLEDHARGDGDAGVVFFEQLVDRWQHQRHRRLGDGNVDAEHGAADAKLCRNRGVENACCVENEAHREHQQNDACCDQIGSVELACFHL